MNKFFAHLIIIITLLVVSYESGAVIINPVKYIHDNGFHSMKIGDDKKTKIYSFQERAGPSRISELSSEITALPKTPEIQKMCDFWRGTVKAGLVEKNGVAIDVVVTNYGYSDTTITCILKHIDGNKVGTQLIFYNTDKGSLYFVMVTN